MALRFGIIGCGAIGQRRHIPECFNNPHTHIVALCDVNPDRVEEVAKKYEVTSTYTDYRKMLAGEDLDAVVVGTPNSTHAPMSIAALDAGFHVLVEKPMAASLKEAKAMIDAAKKNKRFLMIGQNQRLMAPHVKAKQILDKGTLGKPINFQTTFKHGGPDGWSVDGGKSWFFRKKEAVMGVCGDLGVHKIDLMRFLLGQEIVAVNGFVDTLSKTYPGTTKKIDVDDTAFLSVKTSGGVIGTINISWTNYGRFEDNGTIIYCEKGVMLIGVDREYGVVVRYRNGKEDKFKTGEIATNTKQVGSGVMDMFVESIRKKKAPTIDGAEGYKSLAVILAALESSKSGKTVKPKLA